ncbi:adenylate/guanylate cyclase domain-containing protein [Curvivirga aplysinae]|uniref:adenylate/guanylate cyclase domain-containing protein n=1 Tax=Curvivirga aplysinae TaxID=2529852 RepID=UPI0012BD2B11|nr:adenylate/guanylate cyclase domain-containing protein [Curvivirga aplysinae]MTI09418.1 adenylate/guanylate cyclase domain-containing protein [Curvivirga aplysinae]
MGQRLRLISGLILFAFVLTHYLNHALGLTSILIMEEARPYFLAIWKTEIGTIILTLAAIIHIVMALWVIYQRRSLKLKKWELIQLFFGLSIPFLVANHVIATGIVEEFYDTQIHYPQVLVNYWISNFESGIIHGFAVIIVWIHGCIGIHYWLKTKAFYTRIRWLMAQFAVVIPTLALAGYISAGYQVMMLESDRMFMSGVRMASNVTHESYHWLQVATMNTLIFFGVISLTPFIARSLRFLLQKLKKQPRLKFPNGKSYRILDGATALETMRSNKIPLASVCGGRGRCTTCRIRVTEGVENLHEPQKVEKEALERIEAIPSVRLACQIRPTSDITVMPLMPADANAKDGRRPGGLDGMEMQVAVMFVDLRGSTKLGEEKLPYDVLFILNQFFAEMTSSLNATKGHYAQFNGDGLMAIYGLNGGNAKNHAEQAIKGATEMFRRLDELNVQLESELKEPMQIGIGIHYGEAIVGAMGPPNNQLITAIGDNVNIAARLESLCKEYKSPFIISERAAQTAGITLPESKSHSVAVKGRQREIKFFALQQPPATA